MNQKILDYFFTPTVIHWALIKTKDSEGRVPLASESVKLHDEMVAGSMSMTMDEKLKHFDNVLIKHGYGSVFNGDTKTSKAYRSAYMFFDKAYQNGTSKYSMIPISPFDRRFRDLSSSLNGGKKSLYLKTEDLFEIGTSLAGLSNTSSSDLPIEFQALSHIAKNPQLGVNLPVYRFNRVSNGLLRFQKSGDSLFTRDDLSGLSRLKRYMTQEAYDSCRDWVNSIADDEFMSKEALDRSVGLLKYMSENGIPYRIERDFKRGQLQAILDDYTKIRITDTKANENYVASRIFRNGYAIRFSTDKLSNGKMVTFNPTVEDCVNLLKYSRGETVEKNGEVLGSLGTYNTSRGQKNKAYYTDKTFGVVYNKLNNTANNVLILTERVNLNNYTNKFNGSAEQVKEDASNYLKDAIESAKLNYAKSINLEELIVAANAYLEAKINGVEPELFEFSGDNSIAGLQKSYWNVLTGKNDNLRVVYLDHSDDAHYDISTDDNVEYYNGSPLEIVNQHFNDYLKYKFGNLEPDAEGKRFDPIMVSGYMSSLDGIIGNRNKLRDAVHIMGIDHSELRGEGYDHSVFKDGLVTFNELSSVRLNSKKSPFMTAVFETITESFDRLGVSYDPNDIYIDERGIVEYKVVKKMGANVNSKTPDKEVKGYIGQIFEPDERGLVKTNYLSSNNFYFAPGYNATVVAQKEGENKSVEERTKLTGYLESLKDAIRISIFENMLDKQEEIAGVTASPNKSEVSLNNVYRHLYDARFPLDYIERSIEDGMLAEVRDALIENETKRVLYSKDIKQNSTINADYLASTLDANAMANDNVSDAYLLTGGRNMSILSTESDGFFDPVFTGNATNQGIVRYLVNSCKIDKDGFMIKGEESDRCPIADLDMLDTVKFDPHDRQQMMFSNLKQASSIDTNTKAAFMTFGGWNFNDGIVVSKNYAERNVIRGDDDKTRALIVGDKILDFHGNKGVISLIIDPDMSDEEAERLGIKEGVEIFRANPDLDICMSPFSYISRHNAGSTRELMKETYDLKLPNGEVIKGGIGKENTIITHMAVDVKTNIYSEEDLALGKGRKASAQLAWGLNSKGCKAVLKELYSNNDGAVTNLRDLLIVTGLDIDEVGTFVKGYRPHNGEFRNVFEIPELKLRDNGTLNRQEMLKDYNELIGSSGGFLKIPFKLENSIGPLNQAEDGSYLLPVMSSHLRSGQQFEGGTSTVHDYTSYYNNIYSCAINYLHKQNKINEFKDLIASTSGAEQADYKSKLSKLNSECESLKLDAQGYYSNLMNDVIRRNFKGKHNIFRDSIMTNRLPNSATAVWTANPSLGIDEVGMSKDMIEKLGFKDGEYALIWRDPILKDGGIRYLKVKELDSVKGISINPIMDLCFSGDFDGDSAGVARLTDKSAKLEAMRLFSTKANLLDYGVKNEYDYENQLDELLAQGYTKGDALAEISKLRSMSVVNQHELYLDNALDLKVSQYNNEDIKKEWNELTEKINVFEHRYDLNSKEFIKDGVVVDREGLTNLNKKLWQDRSRAVSALNEHVQKSFGAAYGKAPVSFDSMESHLQSIIDGSINTGAKGKMSKLDEYAVCLGIDYDKHEDGSPNLKTIRDFKETRLTRKDYNDVQYAIGVKSYGTGIAGMYSQRGMKVGRNHFPKEVLELTYNVTQSMLQAKKDAVEARRKYEVTSGVARDLWKGYKLEKVYTDKDAGEYSWQTVRDDVGMGIPAGKNEWIKTFTEFYQDPYGLNMPINKDHIVKIANVLVGDDGCIRNIEADETIKDLAAPIDRLAYGGNFSTLIELCDEGANLYSGKNSQYFTPFKVAKNAKLEPENRVALIKSDSKDKAKTKEYKDMLRAKKELESQVEHESDVKVVETSSPSYNYAKDLGISYNEFDPNSTKELTSIADKVGFTNYLYESYMKEMGDTPLVTTPSVEPKDFSHTIDFTKNISYGFEVENSTFKDVNRDKVVDVKSYEQTPSVAKIEPVVDIPEPQNDNRAMSHSLNNDFKSNYKTAYDYVVLMANPNKFEVNISDIDGFKERGEYLKNGFVAGMNSFEFMPDPYSEENKMRKAVLDKDICDKFTILLDSVKVYDDGSYDVDFSKFDDAVGFDDSIKAKMKESVEVKVDNESENVKDTHYDTVEMDGEYDL